MLYSFFFFFFESSSYHIQHIIYNTSHTAQYVQHTTYHTYTTHHTVYNTSHTTHIQTSHTVHHIQHTYTTHYCTSGKHLQRCHMMFVFIKNTFYRLVMMCMSLLVQKDCFNSFFPIAIEENMTAKFHIF